MGSDAEWERIEDACRKVELASRFEPQEPHVHFAGLCWSGDDLEAFVRDEPRLPWWRVVARFKRWLKRRA